MASRAEVERLAAANREVSRLVRAQLADFFGSLNLNKPESARNALLEYLPVLVRQFGSVSSVVAMEWYEEVRASSGKRAVQALAAPQMIPDEAVEAKVRYNAAHLWSATPGLALPGLAVATDKYVKQPGRDTISYNAERNGARYMRVPSGPKTCSFCLTLASRSGAWLYSSAATAGDKLQGGNAYHGDCDCSAVEVDSYDDVPEGHDGREMYEMYLTSRKKSGSGDIHDILYDMRRRFPEQLKDGVVDPKYLAEVG